jgi:hypothetical protein
VNKYATWFRRVMWLGIIANVVLSLPTYCFPNTMMRAMGQRPTGDIVWTAFAANLLILLSLLYVPAAKDPYRYRLTAIFAVIARLGGVIFFFIAWPGYYPLFGLLDLVFLLLQAPLLWLAYRQPHAEWQPAPTT